MRDERTTKYISGTFTAIFHGDYIPADDTGGYLDQWLHGGLEDRDDLRTWSLTVDKVREVHGDPEGYDS